MTTVSKHKAQAKMPSSRKDATVTAYPQVVNYLLYTLATDDKKYDTEYEITILTQSQNIPPP